MPRGRHEKPFLHNQPLITQNKAEVIIVANQKMRNEQPKSDKGKNPPDMFPELYFETELNVVGSGTENVNKVASDKAIASNTGLH
jgi:hypothetical protein